MNIEKSINISDNLRVWMLAGEMKQAELAEYLGMVPGMMSQRLMGVKEWRDEDVERISKLMNVSEEKLMQPSVLGETLRRFEKSRKNPSYRKNFGGRLNRLAGKKGKTIRELSAELGMDYSGVCKWVMGTGLPSAFVLVKIANYFGMTAAQLAGFEPEPEAAKAERSTAEAEPEAAKAERSTAEAEPEEAKPERSTAEPERSTAETERSTAETERSAAETEPEAAKAEPEAAKAEPETAKAEPEEEKTGKCRTVDERREMFRDRLRELIERSGKTAEEVARDTEIGLPLLQGYLEGKYFPGYLMAQKLAEYFGVSTEILSGEAEMPEPETAKPEPEKEKTEQEPGELVGEDFARFGQRLSELIRRTGKDAGAVGYEIGIGLAEWYEYLRGCWLPSKKTAAKIAKYFGVPVDVLLGDEELAEPENEAEDCWLPAVQYSEDDKRRREGKEIVSRAERISLKSVNFPEVIETISLFLANIRDICEYEPERDAIMASLAALIRAAPQKVIVDEGGNARCPVCGLGVEHGEEMCKRCCQLLDWEIIEVGDEVYMSGDWSVRFWVGGKEENGFIWGYDMSFQRCCEHPADLVRSGRNCPELARGLEAAARIEQQEGEKNV